MKKIFTKIGLFILGIVMVFTPFGIFALSTHFQPHVYSKTYYAALVDKVHNLESYKNDKKIILIGGSNVAFGFNSEYLEKEFPDYKVINFGLYAMLGTKIMMDLALPYISEGDMVFLSPEINEQSTSLYFDPISTLKALEDDTNIINKLPDENRDAVIGSYFEFAINRGKQKQIIEPTGVYQRKNFNNYGDISYEEVDEDGIPYRSRNRMALHYDPTMMVDYSYKIDDSFFDYVNSYSESVSKKKANLYYCFSPVNEKSVIDKEVETDYYWKLRKNLSCKVIGNPSEYIMDSHYFYDSNFHLNDSGSIYRTYLLTQDIYRDVFNTAKSPSFVIPDMPPFVDEGDIEEDSETAKCFKYIDYEDSLLVSGVREEYLDYENIVLPEFANGKRVVGIEEYAFKECTKINNIVIPTYIRILKDGCFGKCPTLNTVRIDTYNPGDIIVSFTGGLTEGVADGFKFYIHHEAITSFATNYYWGTYSSFFMGY